MLFRKTITKTRKNEIHGTSYETEVKQVLFKDKDSINHRGIKDYLGNIWMLAGAVIQNEEFFLVDASFINNKKNHQPDHYSCAGINENSEETKLTEKRICRCMNYYKETDKVCKECKIDKKWNNVGEYRIIDYEVPTPFVIDTVGGIDLLIQRGEEKQIYAVEVKSEKSEETLVRMMAEILTLDCCTDKTYKPAICFFKDSLQHEDLCESVFKEDAAFQYLLTCIDVFYITYEEKAGIVNYVIHNNKEEPLKCCKQQRENIQTLVFKHN